MNVSGESHVGDREPPLWETYVAFREIIKFLKDWQQDCIILTVSSSVQGTEQELCRPCLLDPRGMGLQSQGFGKHAGCDSRD